MNDFRVPGLRKPPHVPPFGKFIGLFWIIKPDLLTGDGYNIPYF